MLRQVTYFLFAVFLLFIVPQYTFAQNNSFITIVNPVRISSYTKNPLLSLQSEYGQIKDRNLPATWLLTYDVLNRKELVSEFKKMDKSQELGIFLEVTFPFAKVSSVTYNETNSWHRATSLFLSGYKQSDRIKLIDTVFSKFKKTFGYYPKSVGAWWVDSYSLNYMYSKYGVTGSLGVSDQYDLDGYQVWGTPYSSVYMPNKFNEAIPASNADNGLNLVAFRWAARDPLNGYLSPSDSQASLYSLQDYMRQGLTSDYYKKMIDLYSDPSLNDFGQVTVGLEADYSPESYTGNYSDWMDVVKKEQNLGKKVTTMSDFAAWYLKDQKNISNSNFIQTDDLLGTNNNISWYNSSLYRIGILYNKDSLETKIIDFRVYPQNYYEPYYTATNKEFNLYINLPYIMDSVIDKKSALKFNSGKLTSTSKNKNGIEMDFENGKIILGKDIITFVNFYLSDKVKQTKQLIIKQDKNITTVYPRTEFEVGPSGVVFSNFYPHLPFAFKHRIESYKFFIYSALFLVLCLLIYILIKNRKLLIYGFVIFIFLMSTYLVVQVSNKYYISQTEYEALQVLSKLPNGKVLIYDKDCLRCKFNTQYTPAAAAGVKNYISKYSDKKTLLDYDFQTAATSNIAKEKLKEEDVTYIYLPRYESYIEQLPYLPQDLGLVRVYENANAQIWRVNN